MKGVLESDEQSFECVRVIGFKKHHQFCDASSMVKVEMAVNECKELCSIPI